MTVSPFVSLPTATTLPYTYRSLPASLPPLQTINPQDDGEKTRFVTSQSQSAHPDEIVASCQKLKSHLAKLSNEAESILKDWEQQRSENDLAERRRVAPGWLDRSEKILEPARTEVSRDENSPMLNTAVLSPQRNNVQDENEIDRAFGSMAIK